MPFVCYKRGTIETLAVKQPDILKYTHTHRLTRQGPWSFVVMPVHHALKGKDCVQRASEINNTF